DCAGSRARFRARRGRRWRGRAPRRRGAVRARAPSSPPPARAVHLALVLALPHGLAAIDGLAPTRERELDLGAPVLPVERERHQRESAFGHLARELRDLVAVEEQLALAVGVDVVAAGLGI